MLVSVLVFWRLWMVEMEGSKGVKEALFNLGRGCVSRESAVLFCTEMHQSAPLFCILYFQCLALSGRSPKGRHTLNFLK